MEWILENWAFIALVVPAALPVLGLIAEKTPWRWDNKVINFVREVWALVPVGEKNALQMGTGNPKKTAATVNVVIDRVRKNRANSRNRPGRVKGLNDRGDK